MGFWNSLKKVFGSKDNEPHEVDLAAVQNILGYHFRNDSLLLLALTHRSYNRPNGTHRPSNERLEYLGDSVLGLVIADCLYHDHPNLREGELTKIKAMLVNESTLANVGKEISLNQYVRISSEEERLGGRDRASIISDALESVIGAIYLDGGYDAARDVITRVIYHRKESITSDESQKNFKGELLELIQARGDGMPRYDVVSESGPDHEKEFTVVVYVANAEIGSGTGYTKKEAEQKAAAMALANYKKTLE